MLLEFCCNTFRRELGGPPTAALFRSRDGMPPSSAVWLIVCDELRLCCDFFREQNCLSLRLGCAQEVDRAVQAPYCRNTQCSQWLHLGAEVEERSDQIKRHADQIRN